MGGIATTINQQIELLEKRGMIIPDHEKAKEQLLDIGYFRLGFYWYYFEKDEEHNFAEGTNLDDIIELYYLDIDLKNILLKYIYRIEVHFRTQLVYHASNKYTKNPRWFRNKKYLNNGMAMSVEKFYDNLKKNKNKVILKHHVKYPDEKFAPAWKTMEFFTFGMILNVYSNLREENLKKQIADSYRLEIETLISYFKAILNIRNICSHSNVLFDYNQPIGISRIPNKRFRLKTRNTTNLNASLRLVLFILSQISINRTNELEELFYLRVHEAKQHKMLKSIIDSHINLDFELENVNLYDKSAPLYILL